MSDKEAEIPRAVKVVKRSLLWTPELWEQTERAAARLTATTDAEVTVPAYIRGTVARRNAELLNGDAA